MGWLFGLLLALVALLVGVLVALFFLSRKERALRSGGDSTANTAGTDGAAQPLDREPPPERISQKRPSPGSSPLAQSWASAMQSARSRLAALAALRRPSSSRPQPSPPQESDRVERGGPPSWQERPGRRFLDRMVASQETEGRLSQKSSASRLSQPTFSRAILLLIVVVIVVALGFSFWRADRGGTGTSAPQQLTILIATLPGSVEGQSNAELLAQLQQDLAEVGRPPTLTVQVISEQLTDANSAYALARSRQADLLVWGYVRSDLVPGYFLTLTLAPRFSSRLAPEFPEYSSVMATPAHFPLNRVATRGLSKVELAQALVWVAHFYAGQFDRLERMPSAEVRGNVPMALYQFHWMAVRWLKGDYEGARQAYADLGCPVEFVASGTPLAPRQEAERQVCLAAANNRAVTLLTQEGLGQIPASSLDGAARTLDSIVQVAPGMTTAWYNLGRAYLARGRWDEAVHALGKAVEQNSRLAPALAALSEADTESGNLTPAREAAARAMSLDGGLVAAYIAQGRYLLAVNQPKEAEQVLAQGLQRAEAETTRRRSQEAALREGPQANPERADFTAAWARRNDAALVRVHLARARVFLRQAELEGQAPFLLWVWRLIVGELSPLEKAEVETRAALKTHPDWSTALRAHAQLLIARGALQEAAVLLRNLQEQDPQDLGVYQDLIKVLRRQWREHRAAGRTTEAQQKLAELRAQYQLLIDRQIAPALGYYGLGDAAQEIGEWDTARESYLQALAADPNYGEAYLRLGQVELQKPDEALALEYLDQALEATKKQGAVAVAAYCERGEILLEQHLRLKALGQKGPIADAKQAFQAARELNTRTVRALNGLGRIAYEEGSASGAEGYYRRAQELEPRNFDTLYGLGRVYEARGQSRVAHDYFFQAVVVRSSSIAAHYHLGVAYYALLDEVLALRNLEWVLKQCPILAEQARPRADDTEACAGVEEWMARISQEK